MAKKRKECPVHPRAAKKIERGCQAGVRFILLKNKQPQKLKGLYAESNRHDADTILAWLQNGPEYDLGFEPLSVGLGCLDFDGDLPGGSEPDAIREQVAICRKQFGDGTFVAPSSSGAESGKTHLYYGVDSQEEPLGRDENHGLRKAGGSGDPTKALYLNPAGPGTASRVDVKCWNSYCKIPSLRPGSDAGVEYLAAIVDLARERERGTAHNPPEGGWDAVFSALNAFRHRNRKPAPPPPLATASDRDDVDPAQIADWNARLIASASWVEGRRTYHSNRLGYIAGVQADWNPSLYEAVLPLVPPHEDDYYLNAYENGYRAGLAVTPRPGPHPGLLKRIVRAQRHNERVEAATPKPETPEPETEAPDAPEKPVPAVRLVNEVLALPECPDRRAVSGESAEGFAEGLAHIGLEVRRNEMSAQLEFRTPDIGIWEAPDESSGPAWAQRFTDCVDALPLLVKHGQDGDIPVPWRLTPRAFEERCLAHGHLHRYHPAQAFLDELKARYAKWREKPTEYLETLFTDSKRFACEDTTFNKHAPFMIYGQVLKRLLEPGARMRGIVILVGSQQAGKSAFIEALFPPEYRNFHGQNLTLDSDVKRMWESIRDHLIVECADMAGVSRARSGTLKGFLTRTWDTGIRPAWGRKAINVPRWCTIVGTADKADALPHDDADELGYTRFLPVTLGRGWKLEKWMRKHCWELWCEAYHWLVEEKRDPQISRAMREEHAEVIRNFVPGSEFVQDKIFRALYALEEGKAEYWNGESYADYPKVKPGKVVSKGDLYRIRPIHDELFDKKPPNHAQLTNLGINMTKSGRVDREIIERAPSRIGGPGNRRGWRILPDPDKKARKKTRKALEKLAEG